MINKGLIFSIVIISIILCACTNAKDEDIPLQKTVETDEFYSDMDIEESTSIHTNDASEKERGGESHSIRDTLTDFPHTDAVEYNLDNNQVIINGIPFTVEADGVDYSGGYLAYYIANDTIEKIMAAINNKDLSKKYWRESFSPELIAKAEKSSSLEDFVDNDGKILNYYILDGNFYANSYEAEVPIVIEYSIYGEIYNTILFIREGLSSENSEIMDIWYVDSLDAYKPD